ncbi:MAG: hypothetical protein EBS51_04220 [Planctomycetia bacterium]|nr:hypothetical protein [Planctomycetia bacterium]
MITVDADSAAEALAEANRKNPGWMAIKAEKTGGGRAYQVTMVHDGHGVTIPFAELLAAFL